MLPERKVLSVCEHTCCAPENVIALDLPAHRLKCLRLYFQDAIKDIGEALRLSSVLMQRAKDFCAAGGHCRSIVWLPLISLSIHGH